MDLIKLVEESFSQNKAASYPEFKAGDTITVRDLTEKIGNISVLKAAKVTYVEQAIIRMYRAVRDKQDEYTIKQYLADAEEAFSHYLTEDDIPSVHNYQDLLDARAKYGGKSDKLPGENLKEKFKQETTLDLC